LNKKALPALTIDFVLVLFLSKFAAYKLVTREGILPVFFNFETEAFFLPASALRDHLPERFLSISANAGKTFE